MLNIDVLTEMNPWWRTETVPQQLAPFKQRKLFGTLQEYLPLRMMVAIVGLRRTGKSTLLYQLIQKLLQEKVNPDHIFYFSFDERVEEVRDLLNMYQQQFLKKDLADEKIYLFFDEIQKLPDWQNKLKIYYDRYPHLKIFLSGSASLNLLLDSKESLAGRVFYCNLEVLSFEEFLELRGRDLQQIQKNPRRWISEIKTELNDYLIKPFPEIVLFENHLAKKYIQESIIEKAIFRDLQSLFEIKDVEIIEKLLSIISANPGLIINLDDLSKDLGRSRQMLSNYLYYLEMCLIIKGVRNFKGSEKASSRKLKKYYPVHPSISLALASPEAGKVMETMVQFASRAEYYWREGNKEVDFIVKRNNHILPMESKYSPEVRIKEVKGLLKFMEKFNCPEGWVITEDFESEKKMEHAVIHFIPLWKWILSSEEDRAVSAHQNN